MPVRPPMHERHLGTIVLRACDAHRAARAIESAALSLDYGELAGRAQAIAAAARARRHRARRAGSGAALESPAGPGRLRRRLARRRRGRADPPFESRGRGRATPRCDRCATRNRCAGWRRVPGGLDSRRRAGPGRSALPRRARGARGRRVRDLHLGLDRTAQGGGAFAPRLRRQARRDRQPAALRRRRAHPAGAESDLQLRQLGEPARAEDRRHPGDAGEVLAAVLCRRARERRDHARGRRADDDARAVRVADRSGRPGRTPG